jgi:hypothetical protein
MTVPILAIVSSLLLASNNSSSLQGILEDGTTPDDHPPDGWGFKPFRLAGWIVFVPSSEGRYQTVNLWNRGANKKRWYDNTVMWYNLFRQPAGEEAAAITRHQHAMGFTGWNEFQVWLWANILILVPCLLAGLTSYYTPRVGLSCRSLTHLVYFLTQSVQIPVWMALGVHGDGRNDIVCALLWIAAIILGLIAVFTSIGGTLMQLVGVYRNCLCKVSAAECRP